MNNNDEIIDINKLNDMDDPWLNPNDAPSDDGFDIYYEEDENKKYDSIPTVYTGNTADAAKKADNDASSYANQAGTYNHSTIYNRVAWELKPLIIICYVKNYRKS